MRARAEWHYEQDGKTRFEDFGRVNSDWRAGTPLTEVAGLVGFGRFTHDVGVDREVAGRLGDIGTWTQVWGCSVPSVDALHRDLRRLDEEQLSLRAPGSSFW